MNVQEQLLGQQAAAHAIFALMGHPNPTGLSDGCIMMATYDQEWAGLLNMANYAADSGRDVMALVLDFATNVITKINIVRIDGAFTGVVVDCVPWLGRRSGAAMLVPKRGETVFVLEGHDLVERQLLRRPDPLGYLRAKHELARLTGAMATTSFTNQQFLKPGAHYADRINASNLHWHAA